MIWLPWHAWQLVKRDRVPRMRVGGQSPQSASAISGVTGTHPSSVRLPVLQNHSASWREKSKGRKRAVPSGALVTKPWVPPPSRRPRRG
ncbi:MAG: hypothetical protein OXK77_05395 [Gemmatimonadota bacterium]|nr:hypothetical protein [Gemmatimonadota bacterium]MYE15931.1 hypothetical protein [Gemmatimonadota bacterium]